MIVSRLVTTGVVVAVLAGCVATNPPPPPPDHGEVNVWIMDRIKDSAINNAIIRQHTLFPYHFVVGSDRLNELGKRELDVLAAHYKEYPGQINVRRGDTPEKLYDDRVKAVMAALDDAGVDAAQIHLADALPGGDGMVSEHVLQITEGRNSPSTPAYYTGQGGSQSNSRTSGNSSGRTRSGGGG